MNVEFGVSFHDNSRPHTASINYASRRMQERMARQERQQEEFYLQSRGYPQHQEDYSGPHPATLMPARGNYHNEEEEQDRQRQQRRQQRLAIRTSGNHERGSSAPPSLSERSLGPISPISPMGDLQPIFSVQHTSSMPLEGSMERPLPPLPSRFRLGEDDLPWSMEPWYQPSHDPESGVSDRGSTVGLLGIESENGMGEDPQRVRELEALHQAMMTVDSLAHDAWDPWRMDSVGDFPRGPRSLGWAVSTSDSRETERLQRGVASPLASPPPPPYVVSQWERFGGYWGDGGYRPRSSG